MRDGTIEQSDTAISKRNLMKLAGIAGVGTLVGGTGTVAAEDGDDEDGEGGIPPWEQILRDSDGDGLLETPNHDGFDVQDYVHNPVETGDQAVRRSLVSTENLEFYIDPDGDDSNDGSESAPLATFEEAFHRLPFILQHECVIHVNEGVNSNDGQSIATPRINMSYGKSGGFKIVGDPDNPEDHVIDGPDWMSFSLAGAPPLYDTCIQGVTLNCKAQNYYGTLGLHRCVLNSTTRPYVQSALGGYAGYSVIYESTFGGNCEHAFGLSQGAHVQIGGCDGSVDEAVIKCWGFGGLVQDVGTNSIDAPQWYDDSVGAAATFRGRVDIGEENWQA